MRSRYRVRLAGVHLDTLDSNLMILDVAYSGLQHTRDKHQISDLDGYNLGDDQNEQQSVTVTFELHIYDTKICNAACQKVNEWAQAGGTLYTNDREGQYLTVYCEKYAAINARDWTKPLQVVLTTYRNPYWKSNTAIEKELTGKLKEGTFKLDGNAKAGAPMSVTVTPATATLKKIEITVGGTVLHLDGLSVEKGTNLVIDYVDERFLRVRAAGKSVMTKLQPKTIDGKKVTSDRLIAACGADTKIAINADQKVTAVFTARGRWV